MQENPTTLHSLEELTRRLRELERFNYIQKQTGKQPPDSGTGLFRNLHDIFRFEIGFRSDEYNGLTGQLMEERLSRYINGAWA